MRDNYDDMDNPSRRYRGGSNSSRKLLLLLLVLILISLIGLVVFFIFVPNKDAKKDNTNVVAPATNNTKDNEKEEDEEIIVVAPRPVEVPQIKEPVTDAKQTPTVVEIKTQPSALDISKASDSVKDSKAIKYIDHTVKEGETLQSIADLYSLRIETLISVNKIKNISALRDGDVIKIPDRDGVLYTVQYGDMLSTIARKFNPELGWQTLQELNGLKNENIKVGQELFIPDVKADSKADSAKASIQFSAPIKGTISGAYLQRIDGTALNGVYYSAPLGTAVVAACDGTIFDIGSNSELGRFVSISHADGYKTTYAFLETVEVKLGKSVSKGDVIGTIGTGNGKKREPTLYFILEQDGFALDPTLFF